MEILASPLSYKLFSSLDSYFVCRAQIMLGYEDADNYHCFKVTFSVVS